MSKVIVFQHVAHRILGTLNPTLKNHKLNIRYINFDRTPDEKPSIEKYNALIILGGYMGVYESDKYRHISTELKLIEEALKNNIPILGICLGAQLIAQALGSTVRPHTVKEVGWNDVSLTTDGRNDKLLKHFHPTEKLFQMHGDTFDIPTGAVQLASSEKCNSQAFRYGDNVYGLQFHLEVDEASINRWLTYEAILDTINDSQGAFSIETIREETKLHVSRSVDLSLETFENFVNIFSTKKTIVLGSDHSKPIKKIK
jgi:GMP synthase (glutamine-hydrolysing)